MSKYLALAEEGLVEKTLCPIDQGLLLPNQDLEENIFLYCLSCSYKNIIGLEWYNKIVKKIEDLENESKPIPETDSMGREIFWQDLGRADD